MMLVCVCVFIKLHIVCVCVCVCVCACVFIKLHITAQSGPVILVILCHSHLCFPPASLLFSRLPGSAASEPTLSCLRLSLFTPKSLSFSTSHLRLLSCAAVCVCACCVCARVYVYKIAHNREIRSCHPSHYLVYATVNSIVPP